MPASIFVGAPVSIRGRHGHICAVRAATGSVFLVVGPASGRVSSEVDIVLSDGRTVTTSDLEAHAYREAAAALGLQEISEAEAVALHQSVVKLRDEKKRQAVEREERCRAERTAFLADAVPRIPAEAKAVIIAELVRDASDTMSDYFGSETTRTIILAFSNHRRDLFAEMRKAAMNHPETASLAEAGAEAEHREKYSMGGGYYLKAGGRHSDGWRVSKRYMNPADRAGGIPTGEWALTPQPRTSPAAADNPAGVSTGPARIEQHTHTKHGFEMWIVILPDRIDREDFDRLRDAAKAGGGWYSRAWGRTPSGFAFKSEEAAAEFAGAFTVSPPSAAYTGHGGAVTATPSAAYTGSADDSQPGTAQAERLRVLAESMDGDIAGKLADRRRNTPKQQYQAAKARMEGLHLQRAQLALRRLADLHERGRVPVELLGVRTKAAVIDLARSSVDRSNAGYYDVGIDTGRPALDTPEARALWALIGTVDPAAARAEDLRRRIDSLRFARIPGFFPTPRPVVERMLDLADIPVDEPLDILEPEAGTGAILDVVASGRPLARLSAFERHHTLREILDLKGYRLVGNDFLEATAAPAFDRVMMNPPFENGQDLDHVRHAFAMLRPGGKLVAVMSSGAFFRAGQREKMFRDWLDDLGGEREELPAGSFKESGTGVAAVLVKVSASD